jgi:hypothetical protein
MDLDKIYKSLLIPVGDHAVTPLHEISVTVRWTITDVERVGGFLHGMNGTLRCHNATPFRLPHHLPTPCTPYMTKNSHKSKYSSGAVPTRSQDAGSPSRDLHSARHMSWAARLNLFSRTQDPLDGMSQGEEAVRIAILEKVLKGGRQPPADLMLRCEPNLNHEPWCIA